MTHHTHVTFSLSSLLFLMIGAIEIWGVIFNYTNFGVLLAGVVLGSLLPDIDEPESYIGKRTLFIADVLKSCFGHRGMLHRFIVPFSLLVVAIFLSLPYSLFVFGVFFGYLFHILGDMLTKGGVKGVFYPFGSVERAYGILPKRFRFYTNSSIEKLLNFMLGIFLIIELFLLLVKGSIL